MAPETNWISFSTPKPPLVSFSSPSPPSHHFLKLEDYFLPTSRSWPLDWFSHPPQEFSSQCVPPIITAVPANSSNSVVEDSASATGEVVEKSSPSPVGPISGQRTSVYRGVTRWVLSPPFFPLPLCSLCVFLFIADVALTCGNRHRWTGRFEAHLWDNTCKREGQKRKGRQGSLPLTSHANLSYPSLH